jgi:hypothetical protein
MRYIVLTSRSADAIIERICDAVRSRGEQSPCSWEVPL